MRKKFKRKCKKRVSFEETRFFVLLFLVRITESCLTDINGETTKGGRKGEFYLCHFVNRAFKKGIGASSGRRAGKSDAGIFGATFV